MGTRQVQEDINATLNLLYKKDPNSHEFKRHCSTFIFGTENQEGINKIISYKDKTMLMPASSGDQYLGGIYYGAKKIDLFDINRLTYYVTYLKIIAIRNLSFREFIEFFVPVHIGDSIQEKFWNLGTLKKLLPSLPFDVAFFWDNIMFEVHRQDFKDFVVPRDRSSILANVQKGMPFYRSEEEYCKLQEMLRKMPLPTFTESDVMMLGNVINAEYDVVYLSNIIECLVYEELRGYPYPVSEDLVEERLVLKLLEATMPILKKDGTMLISYRLNRDMHFSTDLLYNNGYFEVNEVSSKFPPKSEDEDYRSAPTDLVLTYRPIEKGNILKR